MTLFVAGEEAWYCFLLGLLDGGPEGVVGPLLLGVVLFLEIFRLIAASKSSLSTPLLLGVFFAWFVLSVVVGETSASVVAFPSFSVVGLTVSEDALRGSSVVLVVGLLAVDGLVVVVSLNVVVSSLSEGVVDDCLSVVVSSSFTVSVVTLSPFVAIRMVEVSLNGFSVVNVDDATVDVVLKVIGFAVVPSLPFILVLFTTLTLLLGVLSLLFGFSVLLPLCTFDCWLLILTRSG